MTKETNREKALTALLSSTSIRAAAELSRLSESTLYRFLDNPEFKKELQAARQQSFEIAIGDLQRTTSDAIETLKRNLHCSNPGVEVRAAAIVLENSFKITELFEITERLEKLENAIKEQTKKD